MTIVSTDALAARLDGTWAIVDCRYHLKDEHWGRREYRAAHIPGAAYVSLSDDLAGTPSGSNGRHPIPTADAMAAVFGRLGIDSTTQVVAYDQETGMFASRLWWMLRYMGHKEVAVLDGGWAKWTREGRPSRDGDETPTARTFVGHPRDSLRLDAREVERQLLAPQALLVDARAAERFQGLTEPIDRTPGHIPGAANHHYQQALADDGTLLPVEVLRETFTSLLGERKAEDIVMYCGSGVSACVNLLAMEHAGLPGAKLFPGSWSEWSSDPSRPVETGPAKQI